ncbi:hypothetical protein DERF_013148 [Dermatophagoides farinae]|uniref:Serine/threonine specific protein phosphatases domain-containing protein n=1 Tax=Dermatophagoides farinae TaxID=6954 RepID=A0A922HLG1_DERFA|nr:hypothetical protein DERF_013148 [Dermatophagoides farinae]
MAHNNHNDDDHNRRHHTDKASGGGGTISNCQIQQQQQQQSSKTIMKQQQKQKKKSVSIIRSNHSSNDSLTSIGIDSIQQQSSSLSLSSSMIQLPPRCDFVARLTPEGFYGDQLPSSLLLYDCIVYVIYCPKHDRIAVTNLKKMGCIWLPFVVLMDNNNNNNNNDNTTWQQASHNGVNILIGRQDPEQDAKEAERLAPKYRMQYLQILQIQLPLKLTSKTKTKMTTKTVTRITQFIHLQSNHRKNCCENTMRVNWIALADIRARKIDKIWGPEIYQMVQMLLTLESSSSSLSTKIIEEIPLSNALANDHAAIIKIYGNFIKHCYPSTMMSYESFRSYFIKNGDPSLDKDRLLPLFRSFISINNLEQNNHHHHHHYQKQDDFIDFHEFLIGLIAIDPKISDTLMVRLRFIFRYYDYGRKNYLDYMDLVKMFKDIHPDFNDSMINLLMEQFRQTQTPLTTTATTTTKTSNNMIIFEDFVKFVQKNQTSSSSSTTTAKFTLNNLCRIKKSLLMRLMEKKNNEKENTTNKKKMERLKSNAKQQQQQQKVKTTENNKNQNKTKNNKSMNSKRYNNNNDEEECQRFFPLKKCQRCCCYFRQQSSLLSPSYRIGSHCQQQQQQHSSIECCNDDDDDDDDLLFDSIELSKRMQRQQQQQQKQERQIEISKKSTESTDLIDYEMYERRHQQQRRRYQYSMDFIFSFTSIANIFIELIQDFYRKIHENQILNCCKEVNKNFDQQPLSTTMGIMVATDERSIFAKYLNVLCSKLANMLSHEEKLIKVNAPAFVFGNIDGNLDRLMRMNKLFFQSFPILVENLIFLGNYSGTKYGFGIECLVYLFSMKLVQPNKVHLLRGQNECLVLSNTNNKNKSSSSSRSKKKLIGMNETTIMQQPLWNECYQKYGKQYGQIIGETLAKIFALLPIIIIVDENIACVHSGIPLSSQQQLILTRYPHDDDDDVNSTIQRYKKIVSRPKSTSTTATEMATDNRSLLKLNKVSTKIVVQQPLPMKKDVLMVKLPPPTSSTLDKQIKINDPKFHYTKSCSGFMTTIMLAEKSCSMEKICLKQQSPSTTTLSSRILSSSSIKSNSSIISLCDAKSQQQSSTMKQEEKSSSSSSSLNYHHHISMANINFKIIKDNQMLTFLTKYDHKRQRRQKLPPKSKDEKSGNKNNQTKINHHQNCWFGRDEFENFLAINNLEFVIRSNGNGTEQNIDDDNVNVGHRGFRTNFDNKCLTITTDQISSSSVNQQNDDHHNTSIVFIDSSDRRIRFIRF